MKQSQSPTPQSSTKSTEMTQENTNAPGRAGRMYRRIYTFLGFERAYNFPLFVIFAGGMLGFTLSRLQYLDLNGRFANSVSPGDWYWLQSGHYRVGITLHLGCILPAGILMIWQFVPAIRHKALLFHRINGYLIILLVLISNAGALMIVRRSFGGEIATQAGVGTLVIVTTIGIVMAYINIKRLQIDQHRAWMLRTMFYLGSIITLRLILLAAARVTTLIGSYFSMYTCAELGSYYGPHVNTFYPACAGDLANTVAIHADYLSKRPEFLGASLRVNFGMALWMSFFLHAVGVEIYLNLTPRESERLRQVSYERQLERGYDMPGSAGLVVERWGDAAPWQPTGKAEEGLSN